MGGVGSEEGRAAVSLVWERRSPCMETELLALLSPEGRSHELAEHLVLLHSRTLHLINHC